MDRPYHKKCPNINIFEINSCQYSKISKRCNVCLWEKNLADKMNLSPNNFYAYNGKGGCVPYDKLNMSCAKNVSASM